jgi:hypothetical protein
MYLYLHAPRRIQATPPNPRANLSSGTRGPWPTTRNDDGRALTPAPEPENNHVITIDL